jgi:D-xylose 1-dehydrogenase (NADP+, D-xylono-1,5-lactone-forming)
MKRQINWGLLSTANINQAVIPPIKEIEQSRLYAVASRTEQRATEYAKEHGIEKSYGSYQALLENPDVDAVYVSIPNGMHYEWILKSLENGKHVLCEKSITTKLSEIKHIKQVAEKNNLLVMEGFMYRYHPYFQTIVKYAQSDKVGEIQNIQVSRAAWQKDPKSIRLQPDLGPGVMGDVGCYCLNFIRTIMGEEPKSWESIVRCDEKGIDMEVAAQLVFSAPKTAQFFCSFTSNGSFANIIGSTGRLHIIEPFWVDIGENEFVYLSEDGEQETIEVQADKTAFYYEIKDFTMAILEDRKPYLSLDDSIGNLRILQDIVENGKTAL